MIDSSKKLVLSGGENFQNYPKKLYNHIIDIYNKNNLYIDKTSFPLLEELTTATRNVLQYMNSKLAKRNMLEIFNNYITSSENKVRILQKFVYDSANSFLCAIHKGSCSFRKNHLWVNYNNTLEELHITT